MNSSNKNLCSECSIKQDCCRNLSGLRLSEAEYKSHFARHSDNLEVSHNKRLFMVSAKDGYSCPNWINEQCSIYEDRPMECRLFPYTTGKIYHVGNRVSLSFHSRTECPQKKDLLMSKAEAKELLLSFAQQTFDDADKFNIYYENLFNKFNPNIRGFVGWWYNKVRQGVKFFIG